MHSLDATHLMLVVVNANYIDNWALVHDSFGTLPSRTQELYNKIRTCFYELYTEHDVFNLLREQMLNYLKEEDKKKIKVTPRKGSLQPSLILKSSYCFG